MCGGKLHKIFVFYPVFSYILAILIAFFDVTVAQAKQGLRLSG
jgi:hypothetical protein